MAEAVHIGEAAKVAGVSVDTIRFYQRLGLVKSVGRSAGGYRLFDGSRFAILHLCDMPELGFSLFEIKCYTHGVSEDRMAAAVAMQTAIFQARRRQKRTERVAMQG